MGITFGSDIRGRGPGGEVVLEDRGHTVGKLFSSALVCRGFIREGSAGCWQAGLMLGPSSPLLD